VILSFSENILSNCSWCFCINLGRRAGCWTFFSFLNQVMQCCHCIIIIAHMKYHQNNSLRANLNGTRSQAKIWCAREGGAAVGYVVHTWHWGEPNHRLAEILTNGEGDGGGPWGDSFRYKHQSRPLPRLEDSSFVFFSLSSPYVCMHSRDRRRNVILSLP